MSRVGWMVYDVPGHFLLLVPFRYANQVLKINLIIMEIERISEVKHHFFNAGLLFRMNPLIILIL